MRSQPASHGAAHESAIGATLGPAVDAAYGATLGRAVEAAHGTADDAAECSPDQAYGPAL